MRKLWPCVPFALGLLSGVGAGYEHWGPPSYLTFTPTITLAGKPSPEPMVPCAVCRRRIPANAGELRFYYHTSEDDEIGMVHSRTYLGCVTCCIEAIDAGAATLGRSVWKEPKDPEPGPASGQFAFLTLGTGRIGEAVASVDSLDEHATDEQVCDFLHRHPGGVTKDNHGRWVVAK